MQYSKRSLADLAADGLEETSFPAILAAEESISDLGPLAIDPRIKAFCQFSSSDRRWSLPVDGGQTLLLLTSLQKVCFPMLLQAWRAGFRWIVSPMPCGWRRDGLASLMIHQAWGKLEHLATTRIMAFLIPGLRMGRWKILRRLATSGLRRRLERLLAAAPPHIGETNRVLVVTPTLSAGGAERLVASTLECLLPSLPDLGVFCQSLEHNSGHDFFLPRVASLGLPITSGDHFAGLRSAPSLGEALALTQCLPKRIRDTVLVHLAVFREIRPETVYLWQDYTNICGGIAALLTGVPRIVLSTVSISPLHFQHYLPIMGTIYRTLAACPNVTLVNNSAMGAADYECWLDLEPRQVRVLHNGLADLKADCLPGAGSTLRKNLGISQDAPVVGAVQRMDPVKDPDLWLASAKLIAEARPETCFLLVGDGAALPAMRNRVEEMGLNPSVFFTGSMENPRAAFDAMDAFLLTSRVEGLPNAIVEAQMMGVPVVAANVGGVAEAVEDGHTARLVKSRDPQDFATAVLAMLDSPPPADVCRAFALSRFGLDRMRDETLALLGYKTP